MALALEKYKLVNSATFAVVRLAMLALLPSCVTIVVAKLLSSLIAAANSFKVSRAPGAESIRLETADVTKAVVAI